MAEDRDDGFDRAVYAAQLRQVSRIRDGRFAEYGTAAEDLNALRRRIMDWAERIAPLLGEERSPSSAGQTGSHARPLS